jgi:hypothetical protein
MRGRFLGLVLWFAVPGMGCGSVQSFRDAANLDLIPTVSEVTISPVNPRKGETVTCSYTYVDGQGDPDQSTVRWLINGAEAGTGPMLDGGFAGGDMLACEVTPSDGTNVGAPVLLATPAFHGAIAGEVFLDADLDAARDPAEVGIAGRTVFLDDNGNHLLDEGEPSTVTDDSGGYLFPDVPPGTYTVAQVEDGDWNTTYPTLGPAYSDDFADAALDPALWTAAGNGVSEAGGILTISRDGPSDAVTLLPVLGGSVLISFRVRNTAIYWQDSFHGFQLIGPCDPARNIDGVSFGFSMYDKFYVGQSKCNGMSFTYPVAYALNTNYTISVLAHRGRVEIRVDGTLRGEADVPTDGLILSLPGYYSDGDGPDQGAGNATVSEIDNLSVQIYDYTHRVSVEDGVITGDVVFGTDG